MTSSLPPPPALAIRITPLDDSEKDLFIKFLTELKLPVIAALEEADEEVSRTHIHSIIFTEFNADSLRKRLKAKTYFPNITKSNFAITTIQNTPEDLARMFRYTVKGIQYEGPNILFSSFSKDLVQEQHNQYWEENQKLKAQSKEKVKVKTRTLTWMEKVTEDALKNIETISLDSMDDENGIIRLTQFVLTQMGKASKKLSRKILYEIVYGIANSILIYRTQKSPQISKNHEEWTRNMGLTIFNDIRQSIS